MLRHDRTVHKHTTSENPAIPDPYYANGRGCALARTPELTRFTLPFCDLSVMIS